MLNKSEIKFDIVMNVGGSVLYGTILKPKQDEIVAAAMQKLKTNTPMSILEAHFKFGHTDEVDVRKTAKACGLGLKRGSLPRCESCAIATRFRNTHMYLVYDSKFGYDVIFIMLLLTKI